ncbi:MAG: type II toxin-antitoxin system death-on-curing family toxin [Desulfobaccales bacterium]
MIYLTKEEIISMNKEMISSFGGAYFEGMYNIKNDNSFEYFLSAPNQEVFGIERYPSIFDKAAAYLFYIIKDHIFCDGNKRTGMIAAFTFLEANGVGEISKKVERKRIVNYAERIAGCRPTIENISWWLRGIARIR